MNAHLLRIAFGFAILAAAAVEPQLLKAKGDSPAEQLRVQRLEQQAKSLAQQYSQGQKQFFAAREKAKGKMINRFETALKQIRSDTHTPAEIRSAKVKKISDEKNAFASDGRLPISDRMLAPLLEYQEALYKARLPVAQTYEKLFNIYSVKLKDDERADKLTKDKESFDRESRGGTVLQRSSWHGTQDGNNNNNIPFVLNVEEIEVNSLKGSIVQNRYPNETIFKVEGLLSGNRVQFKSTRVVQGGKRSLIFTGYMMEDRILGQVVSVATNGKPSTPRLALLHRR